MKKNITFYGLVAFGFLIVCLIAYEAGYTIGYEKGIDDTHDLWMNATDSLIQQLDRSAVSAPVIVTMPDGAIRLVRSIYKIDAEDVKSNNEPDIQSHDILTDYNF